MPVINNISGLGTVFTKGDLANLAGFGTLSIGVEAVGDRLLPESVTISRCSSGWGWCAQNRPLCFPARESIVDRFAPRESGPPRQPFTFLLAARLLWDKGIAEFVEAARQVNADRGAVRFQILGMVEPPSPAAVSEEQLDEWNDEGTVAYLGAADDVRPVLAAADCVVLPSYYREGVPRVLLEAAAMAIPLITTDLPGCRDAVDDGLTGLLCQARSIDSLISVMERMLALPADRRKAMGAAGRTKMEREFREEIVHRAYLDALGKLGVSGS